MKRHIKHDVKGTRKDGESAKSKESKHMKKNISIPAFVSILVPAGDDLILNINKEKKR